MEYKVNLRTICQNQIDPQTSVITVLFNSQKKIKFLQVLTEKIFKIHKPICNQQLKIVSALIPLNQPWTWFHQKWCYQIWKTSNLQNLNKLLSRFRHWTRFRCDPMSLHLLLFHRKNLNPNVKWEIIVLMT